MERKRRANCIRQQYRKNRMDKVPSVVCKLSCFPAKHCVHLNLPGHSAVNSKVKGVGETYSAIDEKGDVSN